MLSLLNDHVSLDSQIRSPEYWRIIRNAFGLFEKRFLKENEPKKPRNIFNLGPKRFRTFLEKRTPAYSLGAPLLALAKLIYYSGYISVIAGAIIGDGDRN